ncbi:LacI family DNA-binding transcriptional regulator [uncultured Sunxiuqinia sp.]|uniref:LacI family DNA-binding transcriptional regulator n=1 Tax=uncultured Sunxiuqinia sp. TaxID=1573825 RepID=UPI0030D93A2B|tara:strand:+ start:250 stop:1293 length:1044 start_codon:yes stop_codon:yes gene_type:complete
MDRKTSVTIHDIARELKISASTVSRALNDNPRISKSTKDKIKSLALKLGYQPNTIASNLRTQKTHTIGIVVPLINRHFFSTFISGVEDVAFEAGYNVIISQSKDLLQKEKQIVHSMFSNRVDGLITSLSMQTSDFGHFQMFADKNIPLIFFDRIAPQLNANKIIVDDFACGYKATQHLIDQGYQRIAHLAGPTVLNTYHDRMEGYKSALKKNQMPIENELIICNRLTRMDGQQAIKQLLDLKNPPDAVFCGNDTSALSMIVYLKSQGIRIPEDFGIVGFSNEPFSEVVTPSISTLKQPAQEMGQKAAELIINEIENKALPRTYQTITMPTELIIRASSSRKPTEMPL